MVAVGLAAPKVSANRFRPRIQAALEAALNRPVHLGAVHLNLFTGPGFTVDDVLIDDDPAAGIEPFAHVESHAGAHPLDQLVLRAISRFSSLRLDTPSVNVVKMPSGPWNIQPLLDRRPQSAPRITAPCPTFRSAAAASNFKFGDTKSVFYISDADVDVYPNENGEVVIRFSGAPARTDQASQELRRTHARAVCCSPARTAKTGSAWAFTWIAPRFPKLTRLFHGSDLGVHGFAVRRRQAGRAAFQDRHHRRPEHQRRASLGSDAGARAKAGRSTIAAC